MNHVHKLAKLLFYLETEYDIDFDTIDEWEVDDAIDFVGDLSDENEDDDKLQDLYDELSVVNTEDFVLAVEEYAEME